MNPVWLESVALIGPGLSDWDSARSVLCGDTAYQESTVPPLKAQLLPAKERRRMTTLIRLAVQLADVAVRNSDNDPATIATVFSSIEGDRTIVDHICRALNLEDKPVSPTHFHNSVHNAPAGYWAIASGSQQFSTSVAAGKDSIAMALLEAASVAETQRAPVLLVACDAPPPPPLEGLGYVESAFGCALLLTPTPGPASQCGLSLHLTEGSRPSTPLPVWADTLAQANPQAWVLGLLQAVAKGGAAEIFLPLGEKMTLGIGVNEC